MQAKKPVTRKEYELRINRVINYIDDHIKDNLTLDVLAETAPFSPYHFHRIFSSMVGETVNNFIKRIRLEKAANHLIHNPLITLTDLAFEYGFSSSSVFSRAFKEYFGFSASTFRNKNEKIELSNKHELMEPQSSGKVKNIRIIDFPDFHLAYVRHIGAYDEGIGRAYKTLFKWAGPRNLVKSDISVIGITYDNPHLTGEHKCRFDACITIPEGTDIPSGINTMNFSPGKCAVYPFKGKAREIEEGYHVLYINWIPESGYIPSNLPAFYIHKNPRNMDTLVLDICLPITPF